MCKACLSGGRISVGGLKGLKGDPPKCVYCSERLGAVVGSLYDGLMVWYHRDCRREFEVGGISE